jgi:hypothetical protein
MMPWPPWAQQCPVVLLTSGAIVLLAATVQSATGFGYAVLAAPLLTIVTGPAQALPVLWLTFLPATAAMAVFLKAEINWVIGWRISLARIWGGRWNLG